MKKENINDTLIGPVFAIAVLLAIGFVLTIFAFSTQNVAEYSTSQNLTYQQQGTICTAILTNKSTIWTHPYLFSQPGYGCGSTYSCDIDNSIVYIFANPAFVCD